MKIWERLFGREEETDMTNEESPTPGDPGPEPTWRAPEPRPHTPEPTWRGTDPDANTEKHATPWSTPPHPDYERARGILREASGLPGLDAEKEAAMPNPERPQWAEQYPQEVPLLEPGPLGDGETCPGCGRRLPGDAELLGDLLGWIDPLGGELTSRFYARLFEAAPHLRSLFPDDIEPQEEKLLAAIKALLSLFKAGDEEMEQLDSALARFGRSHTRFDPPATIDEYAVVWDVLAGAAAELLNEQDAPVTERHISALRRAYEYAAGKMLAAQATARFSGTGRRRRTV